MIAGFADRDPVDRDGRAPSVAGVAERAATACLSAAVDLVVAADPVSRSDAALAAEVLALRREIDRLEAAFAQRAALAHQRGVGLADGARSTAAWLRWRAGMREGDAKGAIEAGAACELLAETGRAWRRGEISSGCARTIVGARVAGHDEALVASEAVLLDLARAGDLRRLQRAAGHARNLARADGSAPGALDGVRIASTFGGRVLITADLDDLAAETVVTALHAYTDPPGDDRTLAQRSAAALVRMAEVALGHLGDEDRPRAQVSIVLDWATLTEGRPGRCDGEFTGSIHPEVVRQLLCDCTVARIVTGPDGQPLDVGRTRRAVPPALRRALVERDGGCRFPGCGIPPGWCEAHHAPSWLEGGVTALWGLALFCDHHHHVIHRDGLTVVIEGCAVRVLRPDGTELR